MVKILLRQSFATGLTFWFATLILSLCPYCLSEPIHRFEPIPYSSIQDSPIASDNLLVNFSFEDFEDGQLNQTGLSTLNNPLFPAPVIISGNDYVDSVEQSTNGFGHSLKSSIHLSSLTSPPSNQYIIDFVFDTDELGYLPNTFGFVWTDGAESSAIAISVTKLDGTKIVFSPYLGLGNETRKANSDDDVFLGFKGLDYKQIQLIGEYVGNSDGFDFFELDHLQFGRINAVPEPSGVVSLFAMFAFCYLWRF